MNYWAIILIVCTVAMVIGPIFMLQPSQRDRRLSELRHQAAQKDIRVRLANMTLPSVTSPVVVYSKALLDKPESTSDQWTLVKQSFEHDLHFDRYWDWLDKKHIAATSKHDIIRSQLSKLDNSIQGVEVTKNSIGFYWTEKGLTIDEIDKLLADYQQSLGR